MGGGGGGLAVFEVHRSSVLCNAWLHTSASALVIPTTVELAVLVVWALTINYRRCLEMNAFCSCLIFYLTQGKEFFVKCVKIENS